VSWSGMRGRESERIFSEVDWREKVGDEFKKSGIRERKIAPKLLNFSRLLYPCELLFFTRLVLCIPTSQTNNGFRRAFHQ